MLIAQYGEPVWLDRCLTSLPVAPPGGLEVVLAVNGPPHPELAGVLARFAGRGIDLRRLDLPENLGFGAANNRAAAAARGERLLLLNDDAWLTTGCLERLATRLDADPGLGWVSPLLRYPDGRLHTVWVPDMGVWGESLQKLRNRIEGSGFNHRLLPRLLRPLFPGWLTAACALVRRRAFDEVGGFDERFFLYFEDSDLGLRLRRAGWRLAVEPRAEAVHVSAGGARGGTSEVEYRRSQLLYYAKHRPSWERAWLRRHLGRKYARREDEAAARVRAILAAPPRADG